MFMGEYDHQLDTKGRMIIPSKFRYDLNERFIITRGLDACLDTRLKNGNKLKRR